MRPSSPLLRRASEALGAVLAVLVVAACGETDSVELLSVEAVGTVNAKLVLDANGCVITTRLQRGRSACLCARNLSPGSIVGDMLIPERTKAST